MTEDADEQNLIIQFWNNIKLFMQWKTNIWVTVLAIFHT